jgi:hypothetical protein
MLFPGGAYGAERPGAAEKGKKVFSLIQFDD